MEKDDLQFWNGWTKRKFMYVILIFFTIVILRFPFVFLFDIFVTKIGNFYVYIWALPEALFLYYAASKLRIRWTSTAILGTEGIIGIPIDYYYEWVEVRNLISPWYAVAWGLFFIMMGLSADISYILSKPENEELHAVMISSLVFTAIVLLLTYLGNTYFYGPNLFYLPYIFGPDWNDVAPIFVPYALATGVLGGYLGYKIKEI